MRPNDSSTLLTLFGITTTTLSLESDREVLQGLALALGTTVTTVAITDGEVLQNTNTGMTYFESMSYQEIIDFERQLNNYEFNDANNTEKPKVYNKKQQL